MTQTLLWGSDGVSDSASPEGWEQGGPVFQRPLAVQHLKPAEEVKGQPRFSAYMNQN